MQRPVVSLFVCCLLIGSVHAQDTLTVPSEAPEWGEVSVEQLRVEAYPPDSNASAVIISDVGDGYFAPGGELELQHHTRVKILSKDGYDQGTVTRRFYAEDDMQSIDDVEGVTYTLDDGDIQTHELNEDDVYVEDVDGDYKRVRFTLPKLEPGAVVEYRYELDSKSWRFIPSWSFQHGEPTLYSEYRIKIPGFLEYVTLKTGSQNFDTVEEKKHRAAGELEKWWVMKQVPALRKEPFITTLEDYRSRLRLQMKLLRNPVTGGIEERFMTSWDDVAERLLDDDSFGKDLGDGGGGLFGGEGMVESEVQQVVDGLDSDSARTDALYDFVRSALEWDGTLAPTRDQGFDEILQSKTGNSAEINLLLISMLQNAGIEAHPVLLSTRRHGKMYPLYPFMTQFNSVIAAVDLPNQDDWMLLDATDPLCPPSMLPKRNLNQKGWLVRLGNPKWIPIQAPGETTRQIFVKGRLHADGSLAGQLSVKDNGYHALETRRSLRDQEASAVLRDTILSERTGVSVSDVTVQNEEAVRKRVKVDGKIKTDRYAQSAGGTMYLNPQLVPFYTENPFKRKERRFPVDFAHPRSVSYILTLRLPEGYTVEDTPSPQRIKLPNDEGEYMRLVQAQGRQLMFRSTFDLRQSRVPPQRYQGLRRLFSRVASAQSAQIVLKEKGDEPVSSSSTEESSKERP